MEINKYTGKGFLLTKETFLGKLILGEDFVGICTDPIGQYFTLLT